MIRPRNEEIKAITALLDSGEFETAEDLAREILKTSYSLFQEREWKIWVHRDGQLLIYGPFSDNREAEKLAQEAALGGENRVYRVFPPGALRKRLEGAMEGSQCGVCGHLAGLHEHKKSGGCWFGHLEGKKWVRDCTCAGFERGRS